MYYSISGKFNNGNKKNYKNIEPFCIVACNNNSEPPPPPPPPPPIPNKNTTINNETTQNDYKAFVDEKNTLNKSISTDIQNINKKINKSTLVSSMDSILKSALTNVMASNNSSIQAYLEAISGVNTDGDFDFSVNQNNKTTAHVIANMQQSLTTEIANSFTTEINNTIKLSVNKIQLSVDIIQDGGFNIAKTIADMLYAANLNAIIATDATSGKILADQIQLAKNLSREYMDIAINPSLKAIANASDLVKSLIYGDSYTNTEIAYKGIYKRPTVSEENIIVATANIQEAINMDESAKSDQKSDVKFKIQNILKPENLSSIANNIKAAQIMELKNINAKGNVNVPVESSNIMNKITNAVINQTIKSNISNQAIDTLLRSINNTEKPLSENSNNKYQSSIDAMAIALAGVITIAGNMASANMANANMANANMANANIDSANMANANIDSANMASANEEAKSFKYKLDTINNFINSIY